MSLWAIIEKPGNAYNAMHHKAYRMAGGGFADNMGRAEVFASEEAANDALSLIPAPERERLTVEMQPGAPPAPRASTSRPETPIDQPPGTRMVED